MKGFLSFLGITFITVAFGLILFSFFGNPLGEFKSKERQLAYQEMRSDQSSDTAFSSSQTTDIDDIFFIQEGQSCSRFTIEQ